MKILVVQLRRVGDILLTTPVVTYLKRALPGSSVDFLCERMGVPVLEKNPEINNLLVYDSGHAVAQIRRVRSQRYDAVLDFMNNPRSAVLTALSGAAHRVGLKRFGRSIFYKTPVATYPVPEYGPRLKLRLVDGWFTTIGVTPPTEKPVLPRLYLGDEDLVFAQEWMAKENISPQSFMVMAPTSRRKLRRWTNEGYRAVAEWFNKTLGIRVYLNWAPGEEEEARAIAGTSEGIRLLPQTTIRQLGALLKHSRVLMSTDSGSVHVAVAVGTPTLTLYGPTRPVDWNPSLSPDAKVGNKHAIVQHEGLDCLGCHRSECPIGHRCMNELLPERVIAAAKKVLSEPV